MTNTSGYHRIVFRAEATLLTPLHAGSGEGINTDSDVVECSFFRENQPEDLKNFHSFLMIPGTSIKGCFKEMLQKCPDGEMGGFFGFIEDDRYGCSKVCFMDALVLNKRDEKREALISKWHGIALDEKTKLVIKNRKFDFEVVEPGCSFGFEIRYEPNLTEVEPNLEEVNYFLKTVYSFKEWLNNGSLRFGGKTRDGFGRFKVDKFDIYGYDFRIKEHRLKWLSRDRGYDIPDFEKNTFFVEQKTSCLLGGSFKLGHSFIHRVNYVDEKEPDMKQLMANNRPVLSGKSFKNVLLSHARKILLSLACSKMEIENAKKHVDFFMKNSLQGGIEKPESDEKIIPGKLFIRCCSWTANENNIKVHTRIKQDCFTGGTTDGALFQSAPVFQSKGETINLNLELELQQSDFHKEAVGLILLVLRDLSKGILAVCGEKAIGRGRFSGEKIWFSPSAIEKRRHVIACNGKEPESDFIEEANNFIKALKDMILKWGGVL